MSYITKIAAFRPARFAAVGIINTVVNVAVLNTAYYGLGQGKLTASFIATSCAVACSFVMNRNFVFASRERPAKQLALFIIVTVSSVLVLQNSVYALGIALLRPYEPGISHFIQLLTTFRPSGDFITMNLSNAIASLCATIWNYNAYRLVVFKDKRPHARTENTVEIEEAV